MTKIKMNGMMLPSRGPSPAWSGTSRIIGRTVIGQPFASAGRDPFERRTRSPIQDIQGAPGRPGTRFTGTPLRRSGVLVYASLTEWAGSVAGGRTGQRPGHDSLSEIAHEV